MVLAVYMFQRILVLVLDKEGYNALPWVFSTATTCMYQKICLSHQKTPVLAFGILVACPYAHAKHFRLDSDLVTLLVSSTSSSSLPLKTSCATCDKC